MQAVTRKWNKFIIVQSLERVITMNKPQVMIWCTVTLQTF